MFNTKFKINIDSKIYGSTNNSSHLDYLQFWSTDAGDFNYPKSITHNNGPFKSWPVKTIEEAINILSEPEPPEILVLPLNDNYSVSYIKGEKTFKVGCQVIDISKLADIAAQIKNFNLQ